MLLNATQLGTRAAALACSWLPCHDFARDIGWNKANSPSYPRLNPRGSTSTSASRRYCLTMPFWVEAIKDTPIAFGVGHNGDGVRLADLDGDGLDDYVWLAPNAAVTLFLNGGRSEDGLHWIWRPASTGKEVASGAGASREQIILADMDGDGKDDLCIVDAKTGGLTLYINLGAKPNGWGWGLQGSVATGIGGPGQNVRLADIDGDGKADYILLGPNGEAHLYLNKGEKPGGWNWEPYRPGKPFAKGIGSKADLVQFKDIDGDGKADYIGIGQLDGSATVYKNLGTKPDGWGWAPMNDGRPVATGVGAAGADVLWGRMEKNGRYSYLALSRSSGSLRAWLNGCSDLSPASNGSSGGSSGSSGSSSGSSGSGDDPGQYLQGGLPIPIAGLGGLGLATSGISAIALLTPYAITAQNALTSANGALQPLSSPSPTSGAVSQAVQALTIASGGLDAVAQQAKRWDLTSLNPGLKPQAQQEQQALLTAAAALAALIPRLNQCIKGPQTNACKDVFGAAAKVASGPSIMASLTFSSSGAGSGGSGSRVSGNGNGDGNGNGRGGTGSDSGGKSGPGGSGGSAAAAAAGGGRGGGGGGESSGPSLLGGGLPFPNGGLATLSLPTRGAVAINSLKPYAITTQNAIATVLNPLKALGASSSAGDVSGVVDSLAAAGSDFSSLSGAADAWELDSFGPGGPIFSQVQTEQAALKTAAKSVADGLNQLRRCIQTPGICKNAYDTVAGLLAGGTIGGPLFWLYTYTGSSVSPSQTLKGRPPPAGVVTTNTATPSSWVLNTVPGTSVEAYKAFIQTLPDRGKGEQIIFGGAISHAYVGTWTLNEAKIISRDPVCDTMSSNARIKGNMQAFRSNNTAANLGFGLDKRAPNLKIVREKSQRYQKMVSFPKDKSFRDLNDNDPHWDYTFEESADAGTWVYTFDHGFDWHHREFAGADIEDYVVPGIQNGAGDTVNSISDDLNGHGTQMAAAAVGLYGGIAKAAGIVGVKYASDINPEPSDVIKAWKWAVADVLAKEERHSKAVFNLPHVIPYRFWIGNNDHVPQHYSPPYNIPRPRYSDWVVPLLAEAWDAGIPVICSTGNVEQAGLVDTMGDASPQRFVKPDNPLIIVGGASADGSPSQYNMPAGPPSNNVDYDQQLQGGVTVYAHSENVEAAIPGNAEHPYDNYVTNSGASYACSYASGLEAYYLGLPTTVMPPRRVDNPQEMKRMLLRSARDGSQGGKGVIHNGVWDLPCSPPISPGSKMALRSSLSEADRVLRILKGLDGLMYG